MGINNDQLCAFIFNLKVINEYSSSFDNYIYIIYILLIMSISNISSILKGKKICSAFLSPSFFCKTYTFYDNNTRGGSRRYSSTLWFKLFL